MLFADRQSIHSATMELPLDASAHYGLRSCTSGERPPCEFDMGIPYERNGSTTGFRNAIIRICGLWATDWSIRAQPGLQLLGLRTTSHVVPRWNLLILTTSNSLFSTILPISRLYQHPYLSACCCAEASSIAFIQL